MKVAYILPVNWGGIPHYTAELANAVSKYEDVVVVKPTDSCDFIFSNSNIELINVFKPIDFLGKYTLDTIFKNIRNFLSFRSIKILNKIKPDIVHFPELYLHVSIFAYLYKLDKTYPVVCTLHATPESNMMLPTKLSLLVRYNFTEAFIRSINEFGKSLIKTNKIIVHTLENKNILIKKGINPTKIAVIPHGVYSFFREFDEELQIMEDVVLFFGHITENKGVEYLIKAMPIVWRSLPYAKLIIAGKEYTDKYRQYINILQNNKFEILNKFVPNELVSKLFRQAKVIVLPYIGHQGHSGVLTIAFSFGKPVVVTNVGSLPDLVVNGKNGFIIPPKDPKALADAIIKILEDDKLRKKMSRNALKKAKELSWNRIAKMHIKVYEEVLEEPRRI